MFRALFSALICVNPRQSASKNLRRCWGSGGQWRLRCRQETAQLILLVIAEAGLGHLAQKVVEALLLGLTIELRECVEKLRAPFLFAAEELR